MRTVIESKVKPKKAIFDDLIYQINEKSNNSKFGLDFKFYQKVLVIFLTTFTFLIFPESPQDSEVLCKKYHSTEACIVF